MNTATAQDGRHARSERTKVLIVDALMDLIESGNLQPTSEEVAAHANVGHRTVFRHFQDMDALYGEIESRLQARFVNVENPISPRGSASARILAIVEMRTSAYEKIRMFRRATEVRRWNSPFLQDMHKYYVKLLRDRLFETLPELERCPPPVQATAEVLLSFETWEQLRRDLRLSVPKAREAVTESLNKLLA